MSEYFVDLRSPSIVYWKVRRAGEEPPFLNCELVKLLFSRSRKEDADEEEDEVEPEMMMEDGTDTPVGDKEGDADDDEEGFLSLTAADPVAGWIGTCIVLYVKGSEEAWKRYAM